MRLKKEKKMKKTALITRGLKPPPGSFYSNPKNQIRKCYGLKGSYIYWEISFQDAPIRHAVNADVSKKLYETT
jgi:hypothetical protein